MIVLILSQAFHADAEVIVLDSSFVDRQVEVKNDEVTNTVQNLYTQTWSSFSGMVPEDVVIHEAYLVLTWSEMKSHEDVVQAEVDISTIEETPPSNDAVSNESLPIEEVSSTTLDAETGETDAPSLLESIDEQNANQIPEIPLDEGSIMESEEEVILDTETEAGGAVEDSGAEPSLEVGGVTEDISSAAYPTAAAQQYPLVSETLLLDESVVETAMQASATSEMPVSDTSETIVEISGEVPEAAHATGTENIGTTTDESLPIVVDDSFQDVALYPMRETASVQYSLDGDSWTDLGVVNLLNGNSAELPLTSFAPSVFANLQIRLVYLASQDVPPILFGNAQLKLSYTYEIVEVLPVGPSDQEPNLLVSSVTLDITKGSVRALLLERGGVFELWSGVTDRVDDSLVWMKLASGNTIGESTPVDIWGTSIFWFDITGETLFAYDTKLQSLTGATSLPTEDGIFVLYFGTEKKPMVATYDLYANQFTFDSVHSQVLYEE